MDADVRMKPTSCYLMKNQILNFKNKMSVDILVCYFIPFIVRIFCPFLDSRVNTVLNQSYNHEI